MYLIYFKDDFKRRLHGLNTYRIEFPRIFSLAIFFKKSQDGGRHNETHQFSYNITNQKNSENIQS